MGQQQLLLVILVTIIVGIATVVAINTFGTAADSATIDGARQDISMIGAGAQQYYIRPAMIGGGGQTFTGITFENISFGADSLSTDGLTAYNAYGNYVLSSVTADNFVVTANIAVDGGTPLPALICADNMAMGDPGDTTAPAACN